MSLTRRIAILCLVFSLMALMVPPLGIAAEADRSPIILNYSETDCNPTAWKQFQDWSKQYYPDIVNLSAPIIGPGWANFLKKIQMSPTTKEQIDAFPSGVARFTPDWAEQGIIRPVDDLLQYAPNVKAYLDKHPGARKTWTYKGKLYAFPNAGPQPNYDGWAWMWRGDVLKKCGFSSPPRTLAQLEKFCIQCKKLYPKMVPISARVMEFARLIGYSVNGITGYNVRTPDGGMAIFWTTQAGKELAVYINKCVRNGWLNPDFEVAGSKDGNFTHKQFAAGNAAMLLITPWVGGTGQMWDQMMSLHPTWKPTFGKMEIFAANGKSRAAQNWNIYENATQFTALGVGNEQAQIRFAKYLNWVFDPKNEWFSAAMGAGPSGYRQVYKVDPRNNKFVMTKNIDVTKPWNPLWTPGASSKVNVLTASSPRAQKLQVQVNNVRFSTTKTIIPDPFTQYIECEPAGVWERYPGTLTYRNQDRWAAICTSMSGDIGKLWDTHMAGVKSSGYPAVNKEIAEAYKKLMGDDFKAAYDWLLPSTY